jgi:hypothetical protein
MEYLYEFFISKIVIYTFINYNLFKASRDTGWEPVFGNLAFSKTPSQRHDLLVCTCLRLSHLLCLLCYRIYSSPNLAVKLWPSRPHEVKVAPGPPPGELSDMCSDCNRCALRTAVCSAALFAEWQMNNAVCTTPVCIVSELCNIRGGLSRMHRKVWVELVEIRTKKEEIEGV